MKKKLVLLLLVGIAVTFTDGCTKAIKEGVQAPLQTEGQTAPPRGCRELRERGGAC